MKNQYFGDVKDYFKYGLLRCCAEAGFQVGVCWMLTPDDQGRDGRKIEYLFKPAAWRGYDPPLYDYLRTAVLQDKVREVQRARGLIPHAAYWPKLVPESRTMREAWLADCLRAFEGTDLWFFDPDNGVEVPSAPRVHRRSSKHVYWDELETVWATRRSILVFQHFAYENHLSHAQRLRAEMMQRLPGAQVTSLQTAQVLYLLAGQPDHATIAEKALRSVEKRWNIRLVQESPQPITKRLTKMSHAKPKKHSIWRELGHLVRTVRQSLQSQR